MENFAKKQKCLNLGPEMSYLGIFGQEFTKSYFHIWIQHPQICANAKFREKLKIPKFGIKNTLFQYFCARIFAIVTFKINTLELVKHESLTHKMNFGIGPVFLNIWGLLFLKVRSGSALQSIPHKAYSAAIAIAKCFIL